MLRRGLQLLAAAALTAALAGCGHKSAAPASSPPASPPAPPPPTLTSAADLAACNELQTNIRIISALISNSVETMTRSLHPEQLAKRTGDTRKNLLYSAAVLTQIHAPATLLGARNHVVHGLRAFAADFGRAQRSVARGDMAAASRQLVDRPALAEVTEATSLIDKACGT
jgi:predicted small lipoprotein YifL